MKLGIGRAHLQFNLPRPVVQVGLGFVVKRPGLDDFAAGQHPVKNIPAHLCARIPAIDVVREFDGRCELGIIPVVTGKDLNRRFIAGLGVDDAQALQLRRLAQCDKFGASAQRLLDRRGQIHLVRRGVQGVGQVQRNVLPDVARQIVAEQVGQIVFGDAVIISAPESMPDVRWPGQLRRATH